MSKHLIIFSVNTITVMQLSLFNPECVRNVMPWTAESNKGGNCASCARFCYLKRLYHAICYLFKKLKHFLRQLNFEIAVKFCYIRFYLDIETISSCLLLRIVRMEMDCNLNS